MTDDLIAHTVDIIQDMATDLAEFTRNEQMHDAMFVAALMSETAHGLVKTLKSETMYGYRKQYFDVPELQEKVARALNELTGTEETPGQYL